MWYDERLTWESTEYGGIEVVAVTADTIWIPSFTLDNRYVQYQYPSIMNVHHVAQVIY